MLGGGVRGIGPLRYWALHLGVLLRLPATGGILAVPVWALADLFD